MRGYIHTCCTTSVLDSFESGILTHMAEKTSRELIQPDYKEIIPPAYLRRMSKVIRMGVGNALKVMKESEVNGIIVGSGAGCCDNTILFIREYAERETGILSPNAFIQSTDNTIAGQIALIQKNNSYNITYIQKGLAFENALMDALLLSEEMNGNVLVGGVDEWISIFELGASTKESFPDYWIGEGASFFIINQQEKESLAKIVACGIVQGDIDRVENKINVFLKENQLESPDLILYGNSFLNKHPLSGDMMMIPTFNYSHVSGIYFTNSSFGMQLGVEILSQPKLAKEKGFQAKKILLVNNFFDKDWGLTYITATI